MLSEELQTRWLPDGRCELTLGKCIPVIVSAATFFAKTESERCTLVGEMTLFASALADQHGYDFPLKSGRFVETAPGKFTLAADLAPAATPGTAAP